MGSPDDGDKEQGGDVVGLVPAADDPVGDGHRGRGADRRTGCRRDSRVAATAVCPSASTVGPVEVEEPDPGRLQALEEHGGHPAHELVAEGVVGVGLGPQAGRVDGDGTHRADGPGVELPPVGRDEPAPADRSARADGLDDDRAPVRSVDLDGHSAPAHQVEGVGGIALGEQELAGGEGHVAGAAGHLGHGVARQAGEQRVGGDQLGDCRRHRPGPGTEGADRTAPSLSRMAAASSVRSMPTGHQAMQRPHPTHPEVSNWSHQVDSLWVSHWR